MLSVHAVQNARCSTRGVADVKPMRGKRWAAFGRAIQQITTALIANDVDLPSVKYALAYHANAFVIERVPFSQPIGFTQNV